MPIATLASTTRDTGVFGMPHTRSLFLHPNACFTYVDRCHCVDVRGHLDGRGRGRLPIGTVLGAFFTLLLYGIAPVSLVMYILTTPQRKRARQAREAAEDAAARQAGQSALQPDEGSLAAGDAVAAERKEP